MSEECGAATRADHPVVPVLRGLGRNLILRGVVEMLIGIMLLINPITTIKVITIIIGALLVIDGLVLFWVTLNADGNDRFWTFVNASVLVAFGVVTVCSPLLMDRLWIIALGAWQIVGALFMLAGGGWRRLWAIFSCVLSIVIGVIFVALPFVGLASFALLAGCVMAASGFFSICTGIGLRRSCRDI